ncbi:Cytosol aminopeptidase catalytic domain containing family protein [Babesia ovata]|uniref:Cytosol aminopeptidase catalytic domain containing family protein n=1 Tax=Babesia ovata TaxID=189622 RepID=A0A2H6KEQ0_9APIC|nr:Cytosol aminopeptidase catalytic domain containing family protein [Babesia ovata]GBE61465.1 Cytosol aminopeptidase catalytic domain containing family protein [Babesia ovata]
MNEGRSIMILNHVTHLGILCFFIIYSFSRSFAPEIQDGRDDGIVETDEQRGLDTERNEAVSTYKTSDGDSDQYISGASKTVSPFREPQPWCMLPSGFWNIWEDEDNKDAAYVTNCATVYSVIRAIRGGLISTEEEDEYNPDCLLITYKDITEAKHRLLGLISSFIASCNACSHHVVGGLSKLGAAACPYTKVKSAVDEFVNHCGCMKHYSLCWECSVCVYKREVVKEKTCKTSPTPSPPATTHDSVADRRGSAAPMQQESRSSLQGSGGSKGVDARSEVESLALKAVNCYMSRQLSTCVDEAHSLAYNIRQCPDLSDDLDDTSLVKSAEVLERFLQQLFVLLTYLRLVNEWIVLCQSLETILGGCAGLIKNVMKKYECCKKGTSPMRSNEHATCGCACLLLLVQCVKEIHQLQCELTEKIIKGSFNSEYDRMPSVAHVRALMLLFFSFEQILSSSLATDVGDCDCRLIKDDSNACRCRVLCRRLCCLLSEWLADVQSSMHRGDSLLRETIHVVSDVFSTPKVDFNVDTPDYMTVFRRFVSIARFTADFRSKMYTANYLDTKGNMATDSTLGNITLADLKMCCKCDNKCNEVSNDEPNSKACNCFIRDCKECRKGDACAMSILESLPSLASKSFDVPNCLTKACSSLSTIQEKLADVCKTVSDELKCTNSIASKVTEFLNQVVTPSGKSSLSPSTHKCGLCNIECHHKGLALFLLYGCNMASSDMASETCAVDSCAIPSHENGEGNCKSLSCIVKKFFTTVCGTTASSDSACKCKDKGSEGCCCMWKESLCSVLCQCSVELQKLQETLGSSEGGAGGSNGLISELRKLCDTVDCVKCHLADIDSSTQELRGAYARYHDYLSSLAGYICNTFSVEVKHICSLQMFLDQNGVAYQSAISSMSKIVEATSDLSNQHESGIFKLDDGVNTLTSNLNEACDRLQSLQSEVGISLKGLDAEKRNFTITPTPTQQFGFKRRRMTQQKASTSLKDYVRYFDAAWFLCLALCFVYGRYYVSSKNWLYVISRNYVLLFTIKGVVMFISYALLLTTCRSYQGYMINISLLTGLLMAIFMSFVSQWWNYTLFVKQHAKPIDRWFRVMYPASAYGTDVSVFTWDQGLSNMLKADMNYMKNIFTISGSVIYNHDPFATLFDDYFSFSNKPISFLGLCDWTSFENQLRNTVIDEADEDTFDGILDYIAFKKASIIDLDFLFSGPVSNIDKVPLDLLWSAWNMKEVLTLERCVAYSILEIVYRDVYGELLLWVASVVPEEGNHMILDTFDVKERHTLAHEALCVPNLAGVYVKEIQINAMYDLFRSAFLRKWSDHRAENAHMIVFPGTDDPTSGIPVVGSSLLFEPHLLSSAIESWRESREEVCDKLYGGNSACKNMVTSTTDLIKNYLSESAVGNKALLYTHLLKYVETSRCSHPFTGRGNAIQSADTDSSTDVTLEHAADHHDHKDATSQSMLLLPDVVASTNDESLEVDNQGRYFLGYWLKHAGVAITTDDVKRILANISAETNAK